MERGAKIFGVFHAKNHDFTQKIIFFPILGGCAPGAPPLDPPLKPFQPTNKRQAYKIFFVLNSIDIVFIFWGKGLSNTNERLSDGGWMLLDIIGH